MNNAILLSENDLTQIQQKILELGAEISEFRNLLLSYQAKIRRTMILAESSQTEDENISQGEDQRLQ